MTKTLGTLAAGILVIHWVEPDQIGLWQSLMIASFYASIFQLGITNGLNRELPFLMGAGKEKEGQELAASAQAYSIFLMCLTFLVTLSVMIINRLLTGSNLDLQAGIMGVGYIISLGFYHNYLSVTFRAEKAFQRLAKVYFIQFFIIMSSMIFVYYKNYYGLILYYSVCETTLTLLMHTVRPVRIKPAINFQAIKSLIKVGFPIFGLAYLQQISKSFARIILLWTGTTLAVGLFAPANAIHTAMVMLPGILAQYLYPKMSFIYGKTNEKKRLWIMVKKITFGFLFFSSVIAIPAWFLLPVIIENYFPKYSEGILAAQLTLITAIFTGTYISINALYSIKAYKQMLIITLVKLFFFFSIPYLLTRYLNPLEGVAAGTLLASVIVFIVATFILHKALNQGSVSQNPL